MSSSFCTACPGCLLMEPKHGLLHSVVMTHTAAPFTKNTSISSKPEEFHTSMDIIKATFKLPRKSALSFLVLLCSNTSSEQTHSRTESLSVCLLADTVPNKTPVYEENSGCSFNNLGLTLSTASHTFTELKNNNTNLHKAKCVIHKSAMDPLKSVGNSQQQLES